MHVIDIQCDGGVIEVFQQIKKREAFQCVFAGRGGFFLLVNRELLWCHFVGFGCESWGFFCCVILFRFGCESWDFVGVILLR